MIYTDQLGNKLSFDSTPERIISLVPSQTELLYFLDVKPIAQTIFCVHPEDEFKKSKKIGGTKKLKLEKIIELKPDLIIGNKEENNKEDIEYMQKHYPVWVSDISTLDDAVNMISVLGEILDKKKKSDLLIKSIHSELNTIEDHIDRAKTSTVAYVIWNDPLMLVGRNTYIHSMLQCIGLQNVVTQNRYPSMDFQTLSQHAPDKIFLSSEPFPFKQKHIDQFKMACPNAEVVLVDGEMFSWYGNRILPALQYFKKEIIRKN